jgi:predicted nuclease of restriction endonuclease-like (RecB) superfamily
MSKEASPSSAYKALLADLRRRIQEAQVRAGLAVNRELVLLYWSIGREILTRQDREGWGAKVIDSLARDLHQSFPEIRGLSPRNLKYMRALADAWPDEQIVQQLVAQIPWGHNVRLLDYVKDPAERLWYAQQAIQHGWSRNVLVHQIESKLYQRQGQAITNFKHTLYIDLLFYQLHLRCFVVVDLKIGEFKPEYAGKMNLYLSAVDDLLRHPEDRPSIGLILCKSQNRLVAEYALRDVSKPMGVATYRLTNALPADLQESLPSIEELQKELGYGG